MKEALGKQHTEKHLDQKRDDCNTQGTQLTIKGSSCFEGGRKAKRQLTAEVGNTIDLVNPL